MRPKLVITLMLFESMALSGCQDATKVGAYNGCQSAIEVVGNDVLPASDSVPWTSIQPGADAYIVSISSRTSTMYIAVRPAGVNSGGRMTKLEIAALSAPTTPGADYDIQVKIAGDDCP